MFMQSPSMCSFQIFRKLLAVSILFVCLRGQTLGQSFASLQADPASKANLQAHFDKYLHHATRKSKADKALSFFSKQTRSVAQQTNLGIAQATLGKSAKALYHFNQAVAFDPSSEEALLNRGLYFLGQKKYALAIQDFESLSLFIIHTHKIIIL
jgi:tetratricopeptide (TPR) repeat protein